MGMEIYRNGYVGQPLHYVATVEEVCKAVIIVDNFMVLDGYPLSADVLEVEESVRRNTRTFDSETFAADTIHYGQCNRTIE
jgi:hypothetical protein